MVFIEDHLILVYESMPIDIKNSQIKFMNSRHYVGLVGTWPKSCEMTKQRNDKLVKKNLL